MESIQMFIIFGVGIYSAYCVYSTPGPISAEKIGGMLGAFGAGCGLGSLIAAIVSAFLSFFIPS